MRQIYTLLFYIAMPFILLRALWRTRKSQNRVERLAERLGFYPLAPLHSSIWVHAVSYGEAVAAEPLLKKLKSVYPATTIVITTMTFTGAIRVEATWKNDDQITHVYMPYDLPFAINRFLSNFKPVLIVIMETELWPNLLHIAGKQKLPILLANARLSPQSFNGYLRIRKFMAPFLKNLTSIAAQTQADAERFIQLGAIISHVSVIGNLKFDTSPSIEQIKNGQALKHQLPFHPILVAASTHSNEEEQLLDIFSTLQKDHPQGLLIIVPRHPERFDEVSALCTKKDFSVSRRSQHILPTANTEVFIGDTMGELYFFYSLADVAFVGGSLVPVGGHNLLEPAALKLPLVTGPHLHNFTSIADLLTKTGTLHIGSSTEKLIDIFNKLISNKDYANRVGKAGYEILERNRGATDRHIEIISTLLHTN